MAGFLTRGQGAGVDNVGSLLLKLLGLLGQRRTGQSHETGTGGLQNTERTDEFEEGVDTVRLSGASGRYVSKECMVDTLGTYDLQLNNAVVGANIQDLTTELVSQAGDSIQVLVLVTQSLAVRQVAGVVLDLFNGLTTVLLVQSLGGSGDLTVMLEKLLEELRTQDGDLGEEQLALDQGGVGVIQNSPDGNKIIQLAASLLNHTVLTLQHDCHAGEILNLSVAHNQAVNVEATGGQNSGHSGQHTGLVLNQTVQDVTLWGVGGRHGSLVQNARDSSRGIPLRRRIGNRQR